MALYPLGHVTGKDFIDRGGHLGFRVAVVRRVDEINMVVDLDVLTGGGVRTEVQLTQAMCGPRSFWGGIPEVGSLCLIGYREIQKNLSDAFIIGFIPMSNRLGLRFDPVSASAVDEVDAEDAADYAKLFGGASRTKRLKLGLGDVGGMSAAGAEMVLSRSATLTNRAGDLVELRDEERTLVTQALHRYDNAAGVSHLSGPVRRQTFWLPPEVLTTKDGTSTLKTTADGYFGGDILASVGAGAPNSATKFAASDGTLLPQFNNSTLYPPITYSNGRTVFYPSTVAGASPETDIDAGSGDAFTEVRTELTHDTDLVQDTTTEVDGFNPNPRNPYIEQVLGTVVGNDPYSSQGLAQYGFALRPQMWTSGSSLTQGRFTLEVVDRGKEGDLDVRTAAGAYLLRILGPESKEDDVPFAVSVQKQGKLLVQVPKPSKEFYGDGVKGVSADLNLLGAAKLFLGSSTPSTTSLYAKLEGGIKAEVGRNTDTGNSVDVTYSGPVAMRFNGATDAQGNGLTTSVAGHYAIDTSGDLVTSIGGSIYHVSNGTVTTKGDKVIQIAQSGMSLQSGDLDQSVMGTTKVKYAEQLQIDIITGGEQKTVTAGPVTETVIAGAKTVTVGAGALAMTAGATAALTSTAAMTVTSGAAMTLTATGAVAMSSSAAMTLTSGALITVTATAGILLTSTNIQLGGPAAVLGVVRGVTALPPGSPTLDSITGLPLQGSAMVRSI